MNSEKSVITENDVKSKKLTKIAKILTEYIRPSQKLRHTEMLEIMARALGFSSLKVLYDSAKRNPLLHLREISESQFDFNIAIGKSIHKVKSDLFLLIKDKLDNQADFDNAFSKANFKRLEFYSNEIIIEDENSKYINELYDFYLAISVGRKDLSDMDGEAFESAAHDLDLIEFLGNLDDREFDAVYYSYNISDLFRLGVVTTTNGKEIEGTYETNVFNLTHDYLVQHAMLNLALFHGHGFGTSKEVFEIVSKKLKDKFLSADRLRLDVTSLLYNQVNEQGFSATAHFHKERKNWKKQAIDHNGSLINFYSTEATDCDYGEIRGVLWHAESIASSGELICYASGGFYHTTLDDLYEKSFRFPSFEDGSWDMESLLHFLIDNPELRYPEISDDDFDKIEDGEDLDSFNKRPFVLTISAWDRGYLGDDNDVSELIKFSVQKLRNGHSNVKVFALAAPAEFPHWIDRYYFEPLNSERSEAVCFAEDMLEETLYSEDIGFLEGEVVIIKPELNCDSNNH